MRKSSTSKDYNLVNNSRLNATDKLLNSIIKEAGGADESRITANMNESQIRGGKEVELETLK